MDHNDVVHHLAGSARGSATKSNDSERERERERVHTKRIRGSPRVLLHARPMGVGAGDDGPRRGRRPSASNTRARPPQCELSCSSVVIDFPTDRKLKWFHHKRSHRAHATVQATCLPQQRTPPQKAVHTIQGKRRRTNEKRKCERNGKQDAAARIRVRIDLCCLILFTRMRRIPLKVS